jgi:signal transduction histidine kinase
MNDVIRDLLRIVRADAIARHISLIPQIDPKAGVVMGDRVQLLQVLLNLTINAFEALAGMRVEARRVTIRADRVQEGKICVSVRDSGPGLNAGSEDMVFEPFYTTKPGGMGMGLSIVRSIVEAHGGIIHAINVASGGALLEFQLPGAEPIAA